jgi:type VI secretion system secreted protein Hcp
MSRTHVRLGVLGLAAVVATGGLLGGGRSGTPAEAAVGAPGYVKCTGAVQGTFTKSPVKGHEIEVPLTSVGHGITVPVGSTGLPSGKRQHKPYVFSKEVDATSVPFIKALVSGENLTSCVFSYWQVSPTGAQVKYLSVTLTNARLVAHNFAKSTAAAQESENYSLTFQKITWTVVATGATFQDCPQCA